MVVEMQSKTNKDFNPSNCPTVQLTTSNLPSDQLSNQKGFYRRFIKRPLDLILSFMAIVVLSPVLFLVAVLVRVKLGSPVIFKQPRPGLNEKIFTMYKFRTMTDERDESGELLPDSVRLTKFGELLRATSLDELPELLNILNGEMSIVGPRPLLVNYLPLYSPAQRIRHEVRPGLTGLAQVKGRNSISWEEKFALDVDYVYDVTFSGDFIIILLTFKQVVLRRDETPRSSMTMACFEGTRGEGGEHGRI